MSIRIFCDGCGEEIGRNYVSNRFKPELQLKGQLFELDILVKKGGVCNAGELCVDCLLKIIKEGREK